VAVFALAGLVAIALALMPGAREDLPVAGTRKVERTIKPAKPEATADAPARPKATKFSAAVRAQAARLTLEQQVAQLFLVGFSGRDVSAKFFEDLQVRGWGAVLFTAENFVDPVQFPALTGEAGVVAKNAGRVDPLIVVDGVPGTNGFLDGLPDQAELGGKAPAVVQARTEGAASIFAGDGIDLVLAPIADLGYESGPSATRAFCDDPGLVAELAGAAVSGWKAGGVAPAPKHFPGQGAAAQEPIVGATTIGLQREALENRDLAPFRALAAGVPAMVISSAAYAAYDGVTPAALEPEIARDLLRGDVGFTGVAISDDLAGAAVAGAITVGDAAVGALAAGVDLLAVHDPAEVAGAYRAVLEAVRSGEVPRARVSEALHRVLTLKAGR